MLHRLMLLAGVVGLAACTQPTSNDTATPVPAPPGASEVAQVGDAATSGSLPPQFIAFGNEPFWSVRVDGKQLHWNSPENMEGIAFTASVQTLPGQRRYTGELDGVSVSLLLSAGPCSDGMSDQLHPLTVRWTIDGRVLDGCARLPQ